MEETNRLFVGIDAHTAEHTAVAIDRFEQEQGKLQFPHTLEGLSRFLRWLTNLQKDRGQLIVGVEGGSYSRYALLTRLVTACPNVYEVNPLYTKQRRGLGTRSDKSDSRDAKAIAEVVIKRCGELPRITEEEVGAPMRCLKKIVWLYEEVTRRGAGIQNHLRQLKRERQFSYTQEERKTLTFLIQESLREWRKLKEIQKKCRLKLKELLLLQGANLTTMKGIDTVLAARLVAHSGGIKRFANVNRFIRYAGIAPLERSSGKTKRYVKSRYGNRSLNTTLYLIARLQRQWNPKAKAYFEKKLKEGKTKQQAHICVMKRVACIVYGILKNGEEYRG